VLYALFGVHGWLALAWPALSGIGLVAVVYAFARRFFGALAGLVAGVFAATAPTWVDMSTGLWPDAPPVFLGALSLYCLSAWVEDDAPWGLVLSACSASLAILLKMTSLYLGLPVLFLLWQKFQGGWWRTWQAWLFALVALVPSVMWYGHAYGLFLRYGNTFGILGAGYLKFATAALLASPRFYLRTFLRLLLFHVTPLGGLLVAVGLASRIDRPNQMLLPVWIGTIVLYLLVVAQGVDMGHGQYALPLVPPCAILAGRGFVTIYRRLDEFASTRTHVVSRVVGMVVVGLMAANAAAANYGYQTRGTGFRKLSRQKMRTGVAVATRTPPGALIVVVDGNMNGRAPERSMTPPEVFYFSDRRGWYRAMSWLTNESIDDLRTRGAAYLAVSANDADVFRHDYAELYREYARRYQMVMDNEDGILYALGDGPGHASRR
jgi:4-amino-4-deoxy-L-arabinose transferase-like glycosyltransferase